MAFQALLSQSLDAASILQPTHILYLKHQSHFGQAHSTIHDFTTQLLSSYSSDTPLNTAFLETAQRVHKANPALQPTWHIVREHWYSDSSLQVFASSNTSNSNPNRSNHAFQPHNLVATLHAPISAMGTTRITFFTPQPTSPLPPSPPNPAKQTMSQPPSLIAPHHPVTLNPTTITTRAYGFVANSIPYLWAPSHFSTTTNTPSTPSIHSCSTLTLTPKPKRGAFSLYTSPHLASLTLPLTSTSITTTQPTPLGKKIHIASYQSFSGRYELGGLLAVDAREVVDVLVAVTTAVGLLGARESFNRGSAR